MSTVHVDPGPLGEPGRLQAGIRTAEGIRFLRGLTGTRVRQNGCAAAAYAALYANVDVITAYPIRPYTAIMMNLAQFIADGILDAEYIHADGEHSQFSAAFGAGSCGARAYTGSSGVGVTYGYEMYSIISGARIPVQMAIADRTLDPPGDFGSEHTDALCTRDMGWLLGWAATPQEVFDKSLLAYAIGEDPRVLLPQMVAQDGYFVSHIAGEVEMPSIDGSNGVSGVNVLFGTIFGLSAAQALIDTAVAGCVCVVLVVIARPLLFASIDEAVARARRVPVRLLGAVFLGLVGVTAAAATQAVGALLLLGLLAAPAGAAQRLTARPFRGMWLSAAFAVLSVWAGLLIAYAAPTIPPSFGILAVATGTYLAAIALTATRRTA